LKYIFISVDIILDLNDLLLNSSKNAVHNLHIVTKLESAVRAVESFYLYHQESDVYEIAARYAYHIALGHCFIDGNKRTALLTTILFLNLNSEFSKLNNINIEIFEKIGFVIEDLVTKDISVIEFAEYLRSHFK